MRNPEAYRNFDVKGTDPLEPGSIGYGFDGVGFEPQKARENFLFPKYSDRLCTNLS